MPSPTPNPVTAVVLSAAGAHCHRAGDPTRDHRLDALGFDSLDRFALAVALEHATGRPLPDHVVTTAGTLGDLINHLTPDLGGTP